MSYLSQCSRDAWNETEEETFDIESMGAYSGPAVAQEGPFSVNQLSPDTHLTLDANYAAMECYEQDYTYGLEGHFQFTDDALQDIYSSHCQSEYESYVAQLGTAQLQSELEWMRRANPDRFDGYDPFSLEELFMESYIAQTSADVYVESCEVDEFAHLVEVSDQDYLFEIQEDVFTEQVLDPVNIIQGPDVVFVTTLEGKTQPLPMVLIQVRSIQGKGTARYYKALVDTGSTTSLAHARILPDGTKADLLQGRQGINTAAGVMHPLGNLTIDGLRLPEFDRNAVIESHQFKVFSADCRFDLILGMDFLQKIGANILLRTLELEIFGVTLPMSSWSTATRANNMIDSLHVEDDIDFIGDDVFTTQIAEARYEAADLDTYVEEYCTHLNPRQREQLRQLLVKHQKLFDGNLGRFDDEEMDIELKPNTRPVWKRPYPVPHHQLEVFRKELNHLVEIGVLAPATSGTQWALPTFIVPKKS